MDSVNSLDESSALVLLLRSLFCDFHAYLRKEGYDESSLTGLNRDWAEVQRRYNSEGISFLTKVLPAYGKAFDRSLDEESKFNAAGFHTGVLGIPEFFSGVLGPFYSDGVLASKLPGGIVRYIRQICYLVYKYELPCSSEDEQAAVAAFVARDHEVGRDALFLEYFDPLLIEARSLIHVVLRGWNPQEVSPTHGPGAVASREKEEEKYFNLIEYTALSRFYPYSEYFRVGGRTLGDWISGRMPQRHVLEAGSSRLVCVPKDSRGPRVICVEPKEYQWIQQGLMRALVARIQAHPLTSGFVNFDDQTINQRLALESSITQENATIDLKDASDHVSRRLVEMLFPKGIFDFLDAARTPFVELPEHGGTLWLSKMAGMGSAICFPIEALCFWAIAKASLRSLATDGSAPPQVYVYGDDIVVPTHLCDIVVEALTSVGLRVNLGKTFSSGSFRESCGVDAYNGVVVTPVRLRARLKAVNGSRHLSPRSELHYVSALDALANSHFPMTGCAASLASMLDKYGIQPYWRYCQADLPYPTIQAPEDWSPSRVEKENILLASEQEHNVRWNEQLQRHEVLRYVYGNRARSCGLTNWERLLSSVFKAAGSPEVGFANVGYLFAEDRERWAGLVACARRMSSVRSVKPGSLKQRTPEVFEPERRVIPELVKSLEWVPLV